MPFYKANDKYNATLTSGWTSSPADNTLSVSGIPSNFPTIVVVGRGTSQETVFTVTSGGVGQLTGVARLRGANVDLAAGLSVECINNEEFINQLESSVSSAEGLSALIYGADGGINDSYEISLSPEPDSYSNLTGVPIQFKANTANTGAATLNINGLGAKNIKKLFNEDLSTGDIETGQIVSVTYDGTNFQLQSGVLRLLDEDDMVSNSAVSAPSQQSVKAYVDNLSGVGGWTSYTTVTPTTGTLDSPSFEIVFSGVDLTSVIYPGMRVKITQSTVKFFIVTKIAFSTNTTVTLYGGTDYSLVASGTTAISAFSYSSAKIPAAFPADPAKWTVEATDTTNRTQSSPVAGTWYNLGSVSMSFPIGIWEASYQVSGRIQRNSSTDAQVYATLSTGNNSETDKKWTGRSSSGGASGTIFSGQSFFKQNFINLSSKTTYYLNLKSESNADTLMAANDLSTAIIRAVCAYL